MTRIGVDFDGTLAVWPRVIKPNYGDPIYALENAAALIGAVRCVRRWRLMAHEVIIITGRDEQHLAKLRYWSHIFFDEELPIITRPYGVGISCETQATWKSNILRREALDVYIGDNDAIDRQAAHLAGVPFRHAETIRGGDCRLTLYSGDDEA
jgi:hypothetical protein